MRLGMEIAGVIGPILAPSTARVNAGCAPASRDGIRRGVGI